MICSWAVTTASVFPECSESTALVGYSGNDVIELEDGKRFNEIMFWSDKAVQEKGVSFCSGHCLIFCHLAYI